MEIELKYNIPDSATADLIWENELFRDVEEAGSREVLNIDARYFDTENFDLARNEVAYRVRREGDRLVAALKWKGHTEEGLHVREEINVPVEDDFPDLNVFHESSVGCEVCELAEDKELKCILQTACTRRRFRIDTDTGLFEFSVDSGEIVTDYGVQPLNEVEIELFTGETEELLEIGKKLQEKYGLKEEDRSKYYRGLLMIEENRR
ncbi:MAG: CYTH domain-containing protein [Bacillota bacterium]